MTPLAEKHAKAIDEAVRRLMSKAANLRGLSAADVTPRVRTALEKYLFRDNEAAGQKEILAFVDEIRPDDLCLILACENGDEKAWEDLVANFDSTVKSAARKMSPNADDSEDLAGSIWAELYGLRQDADGKKKSKLAYYSGRGSLAGWLRAVVSQLAIDEFRKQSRFVQVEENREFENLAEESSNNSSNNDLVHHADDPEVLLVEKQASDDVEKALTAAIGSLDAEDRLILRLYYFNDLKLKDIAATFGYHEATASRKISRLHAEIRKSVERSLHERHGWSDAEVRHYLSETAMKLGVSIEKLFAVMVVLAILQDIRL
ncbi:MAG TPA: sigma-70 family RNA polymerase sigma factor [Pyrinomonadaceae bacterium]|nr:sigma-70 family RNA polymerase sigma factor [Pyrinomonadaceae bacterium]